MILILNHLHLRDLILILRSTYDDFAHLCIHTHTHTYELFLNIKKGKMYHILMLIMYIYIYIYIYIAIAIFGHGTSLIFFLPLGDSNRRRRSQSTDMLCSRQNNASPKKEMHDGQKGIHDGLNSRAYHVC